VSRNIFCPRLSSNQYPGNSPNPFRQVAKLALSGVLPRPMFIARGPRTSHVVCLTFDDGPDPRSTPRLLDVLAKENVKATFFVLGRLAELHPDIVKRIEVEGHTVASHSYSHPDPMAVSSLAMYLEVRRSKEVLQNILGHRVHHYRPPRGKVRTMDLVGIWALRQAVVLWNIDPKDFAQPSSKALIDWFTARPLCGGDLVLLHDTESHTADALPSIIAAGRRAGLQFEGLDRWTRWLPSRH
jgi:peptidoglycan/xylan/chitin deacetylase (PgdA/CDA1 family)